MLPDQSKQGGASTCVHIRPFTIREFLTAMLLHGSAPSTQCKAVQNKQHQRTCLGQYTAGCVGMLVHCNWYAVGVTAVIMTSACCACTDLHHCGLLGDKQHYSVAHTRHAVYGEGDGSYEQED